MQNKVKICRSDIVKFINILDKSLEEFTGQRVEIKSLEDLENLRKAFQAKLEITCPTTDRNQTGGGFWELFTKGDKWDYLAMILTIGATAGSAALAYTAMSFIKPDCVIDYSSGWGFVSSLGYMATNKIVNPIFGGWDSCALAEPLQIGAATTAFSTVAGLLAKNAISQKQLANWFRTKLGNASPQEALQAIAENKVELPGQQPQRTTQQAILQPIQQFQSFVPDTSASKTISGNDNTPRPQVSGKSEDVILTRATDLLDRFRSRKSPRDKPNMELPDWDANGGGKRTKRHTKRQTKKRRSTKKRTARKSSTRKRKHAAKKHTVKRRTKRRTKRKRTAKKRTKRRSTRKSSKRCTMTHYRKRRDKTEVSSESPKKRIKKQPLKTKKNTQKLKN